MENSAWSYEDIEFLAKEMEDKSRGEIIDAMKEDQYFAPQYDEADGDEECLAEIDKEVLEVSDRIFNEVIELGVEDVAKRLNDGFENDADYGLRMKASEAFLAEKWRDEQWSKKQLDDWCWEDSTVPFDEIDFIVEPSRELIQMDRQLSPALDKLFPKVWSYRERLDLLEDLERVHLANAENEEGFAYAIDEETGSLVIDLNDGRGRHELSPDDLPKMIEMNLGVLYDECAFHKRERLDDDSDHRMIDLFERAERDLESLNESEKEITSQSTAPIQTQYRFEPKPKAGLRLLDVKKDFNNLLPDGAEKFTEDELVKLKEYIIDLSDDEFWLDEKSEKVFRVWSSDVIDFDLSEDKKYLNDSGAADILEEAVARTEMDAQFCRDEEQPEGLKRAEKWKAFFEEKLGALRELSGESVRLSVPAKIQVPFLPTRKHHRVRFMDESVEIPVEIQCPKESEFPVAIRVTDYNPVADVEPEDYEERAKHDRSLTWNDKAALHIREFPEEELRAFKGELYKPVHKFINAGLRSSSYASDLGKVRDNISTVCGWHSEGHYSSDKEFNKDKSVVYEAGRKKSLNEIAEIARNEAAKRLFFDGKIWERVGEPYFQISSPFPNAVFSIQYVDKNYSVLFEETNRYFSVLHEKEAKAAFEAITGKRVPLGNYNVEVLLPEMVRVRDRVDLEAEKVKAAEKTLEVIAKKAEPEAAPSSALEDFEKEMEALMAGTNKNPFLAARRILANWKDERKDELNESFRELGLDDGKKFVAYFEGKFGPDKSPRRLEKTEKERKNSDPEMGR